MAFPNFLDKVKQLIGGIPSSLNQIGQSLYDDKGWFQQGKFTPIKGAQQSIQNWAQQNPQPAQRIIQAPQQIKQQAGGFYTGITNPMRPTVSKNFGEQLGGTLATLPPSVTFGVPQIIGKFPRAINFLSKVGKEIPFYSMVSEKVTEGVRKSPAGNVPYVPEIAGFAAPFFLGGISPKKGIKQLTKAEVEATFAKFGKNVVKDIPEELKFLVEKAKVIPKEKFIQLFNKELTSQNLTRRDTAQNIVKLMKKSGIVINDFYTRSKIKPPVEGGVGETFKVTRAFDKNKEGIFYSTEYMPEHGANQLQKTITLQKPYKTQGTIYAVKDLLGEQKFNEMIKEANNKGIDFRSTDLKKLWSDKNFLDWIGKYEKEVFTKAKSLGYDGMVIRGGTIVDLKNFEPSKFSGYKPKLLSKDYFSPSKDWQTIPDVMSETGGTEYSLGDRLFIAKPEGESKFLIYDKRIDDVLPNKFKTVAEAQKYAESVIERGVTTPPLSPITKIVGGGQVKQGISEPTLKIKGITPKTIRTLKIRVSPQELPISKVKQVQDIVYNSEVDPNLKSLVIKNNEKVLKQKAEADYKEWQSQVFNEILKQEKTKTKQALSTIVGKLKTETGSLLTKDVENLKDISSFAGGGRDIYRNFKVVFGNKYGEAKRLLLDPFDKSKSIDRINFENKWINNLKKNVIDKGIKKGSKLSELTQLYGEGQIDKVELYKRAGNDTQKVIAADNFFRNAYDDLLNEVNRVRKQIYPNSPDKLIPKRKDYYRHFREIATGYKALINIFETPSGVESKLSGVSDFTKPKSKWLSFAQKRLGMKSDVDAVGGFLDYIRAAGYATHVDPYISKFRSLATELAEKTAPGTPQAGKVNNFIEFLNDFSNDLSGKTNPLDRAIQKWIPGGRQTFRVLNWLNSRVKANVILGNVSSSIAQIFNVPQGIASAGPVNSVKGLNRTFGSLFKENKPMNESGFIKERYTRLYDKFDTSFIDNAKQIAAWMVGALDEVGTKYIWNSHYEKALSQRIRNPIKYADDLTRSLVAGRAIGEVPLAQKSRLFQMVAPFQLEVGNLWWVMKDMVDQKSFGKIAILFLANYVFNRAAVRIRGSDVTIDPIQATIEGIRALNEEEDKKKGLLRLGGRLAGEVISNIPGGQTLAAVYPEYGFKVGEIKYPTREQFFGKGDPMRFGGGLLVQKGLQDPLYKILPPFGGSQIKKIVEGVSAVSKGYSDTPSGRIRYPIEKNVGNYLKGALFGENSLPGAQEYFDTGSALGEKQSEKVKSASDKVSAYQEIINKRELDKVKTEFKYSNDNIMQVGDIVLIKTDKGTIKEIDTSFQPTKPTLTGMTELDKKLVSKFNSEVTKKKNDILDLYEAGKLSAIEADKMITEIQAISTKVSSKTKKGKAPKKISVATLKVSAPKRINIKMKIPKMPKFKKMKKNQLTFKKSKRTLKIKV